VLGWCISSVGPPPAPAPYGTLAVCLFVVVFGRVVVCVACCVNVIEGGLGLGAFVVGVDKSCLSYVFFFLI
jgi:hypothetical protein